jgi:hypothetical protein
LSDIPVFTEAAFVPLRPCIQYSVFAVWAKMIFVRKLRNPYYRYIFSIMSKAKSPQKACICSAKEWTLASIRIIVGLRNARQLLCSDMHTNFVTHRQLLDTILKGISQLSRAGSRLTVPWDPPPCCSRHDPARPPV